MARREVCHSVKLNIIISLYNKSLPSSNNLLTFSDRSQNDRFWVKHIWPRPLSLFFLILTSLKRIFQITGPGYDWVHRNIKWTKLKFNIMFRQILWYNTQVQCFNVKLADYLIIVHHRSGKSRIRLWNSVVWIRTLSLSIHPIAGFLIPD